MRIAALYIERFAELERVALTFEGTMTVIYGPNDAGKSTLLRFIRAMLFGFPPRPASGTEPPAADYGAQGGHLDVEGGDGFRYRIARRETASGRGRAGQTLAVTREDGTTGGEAQLRELLGGLSGELYRSLFAFGLDELQELRTLQSDELGSYLYGAGFGGQGAAIVAAERKLAAEMEQLYRPRGKLQPVGKLLAAMADADGELRRSKEQIGRYEALLADRDAAETAIAAAGQQLQRANANVALLGVCLQAQASWQRLQEASAELAQLPASRPMPAEALPRFERLLAEREAGLQAADRLQLRREQLAAEQERLPAGTEAAGDREQLAALAERLPLHRRAQLELAELAATIDAAERELGQQLRRIGAGWSAETLAAQPAMPERAERVRSYGERFARSGRELEQREYEAVELERQLAEARERLAERERVFAATPAGSAEAAQRELALLPEAMQALRSGAGQLARQRLELRHAAERERDERSRAATQSRHAAPAAAGWLVPALVAAGAAVAAAAVVLALAPRHWAAAVAAAACAALAAGAIAAAVRRGRRAKAERGDNARGRRGGRYAPPAEEASPRLEALAQEKERLEQAVRRNAASLNERVEALRRMAGTDGTSGVSSGAYREAFAAFAESSAAAGEPEEDELPPAVRHLLAAAEQRHTAAAERLGRYKRQAEQLGEAQAAVREQEARLAASRTAAERAGEQRRQLEASWREWLAEQRLPQAEHPETTLETLRSIETAYSQLQALHQLESKRDKLRFDAESFVQAAERLLGSGARQDPGAMLLLRQEEAECTAAAIRRREALAEELLRLDEERQLAAAGLARIEARIAALWAEAGAADEEQFRRLVLDAEHAASLRAEAAQLEALLEVALGRGGQRLDAEALLAANDAPALREQREAALSEAERAERELSAQHDRRGRLRSELEQLERGDSHALQLAKLEAHKAQLAEHLERWAGLALGAALFRKTRELYERDRQPAVLQLASAYFADITQGKYTRVMAPLGVKKLFVRREADGRQLDSALLSRGTAEQLYLAMRLSLAEQFARNVRLPIVMDDIFVNFDAARLRQTLPVLGQVAERHQLLLFTCHTHMAEAVAAVHPGAQVAPLQPAAHKG